jgi:hypothetical protein
VNYRGETIARYGFNSQRVLYTFDYMGRFDCGKPSKGPRCTTFSRSLHACACPEAGYDALSVGCTARTRHLAIQKMFQTDRDCLNDSIVGSHFTRNFRFHLLRMGAERHMFLES